MSSDELDNLRKDVYDHLEDIKKDTDDEEVIRKLDRFSQYLAIKDYKSEDDDKKKEQYEKINKGLSFYQRFKQSFEKNMDVDPGRLLALTDGIFGMVMTLLVFGMALPEIELLTAGDFLAFLHSIAPTFGITIVSFVLVSSFWVYHHEFIKVKNLNLPYLWLNIFYLACISFIPFSTSIIGTYSHFFISEIIFGTNILFTIFSFLLMFRYAYNRGFLENKPSKKEKTYIYQTFFIIMGLTVIVNLLDFNVSSNFIYLFLLVPVISTIRDINFRMNQ